MKYKGFEDYPTYIGGFCSIGIRVMVLIWLLIKVSEIVQMSDPDIISYSRVLYQEEVNDLGDINLADHMMDIGIYFTKGQKDEFVQIPKDIGRIEASVQNQLDVSDFQKLEVSDCSNNFKNVN